MGVPRGAALALKGSIGVEPAAGPQVAGGAGERPLRRSPGRDVDHVAADHGVDRPFQRPGRRGHVDVERRAQVGAARRPTVTPDAAAMRRGGIAPLPNAVWEGGGEVEPVLAGASGQLQDGYLPWPPAGTTRRAEEGK